MGMKGYKGFRKGLHWQAETTLHWQAENILSWFLKMKAKLKAELEA